MADKDDDDQLLKPGEVCRRSGVSRQSLYQYRLLGLINPKVTTKTGRHLYNDKTIRRLGLIKGLVNSGYSLKEVRKIFFKDGR